MTASDAAAIVPTRRRRWLIASAVLLPAVAVLALLAYGMTVDSRYIDTPLLAKPAAPFALTLFDGSRLTLAQLRGKVVFLNFWASWCPPCRAEARTLEAASRRYAAKDVVFVGVNIQDKEPDAREFLAEFGVTYPNGIDRGSRISIDYGVWGVPETFIIGRDGRILYKHVGGIGEDTIATKLDEASRGVITATEGRGEFQSIK